MAHAFRIRFWETFNAPGTYDILTDNQYKLPNSNDGCMWLRAPTACPEWDEGTEEDEKILHWLSRNAGLTSECITLRVSYWGHKISKSTSMDCNKINVVTVKVRIMWESPGDPHAIAIQWVHMVKDPPVTILHVHT